MVLPLSTIALEWCFELVIVYLVFLLILYTLFKVEIVFCSYFRKSNLFGLACFENMPVANASERGARMKSVGILATSYTLLYRHMQFLETQVKYVSFPFCSSLI